MRQHYRFTTVNLFCLTALSAVYLAGCRWWILTQPAELQFHLTLSAAAFGVCLLLSTTYSLVRWQGAKHAAGELLLSCTRSYSNSLGIFYALILLMQVVNVVFVGGTLPPTFAVLTVFLAATVGFCCGILLPFIVAHQVEFRADALVFSGRLFDYQSIRINREHGRLEFVRRNGSTFAMPLIVEQGELVAACEKLGL